MRRRCLPALLLALAVPGALAVSTSSARAQETELPRLRAEAAAHPSDALALRALGLGLLRAGHHREAQQQLTRAAQRARGSQEALFDVARVAFAQGDHAAAERACRALSRAGRSAPLALVCNARADLVWNRSARAFDTLGQVLAAEPTHHEALVALGEAHRLRAAVAEGEDAYRRAAASRPTEPAPHLGLGLLYTAAGRADDARQALRRALELAPNDPEVQLALGRLTAGAEGRALLERAAAGRPGWADAHVALADALLEDGQAGPAEAAYRAALGENGTSAQAHAGLGRALLSRGALPEAEAELRAALARVGNDAGSARALGEVLARTERVEEALEQFRHAADLDPSRPEPLLRAAELALAQQRDVLASGFLDRLLTVHPDLAAGLALYGDVMRARRDTARARDYYQRALGGRGALERARVEEALRALR